MGFCEERETGEWQIEKDYQCLTMLLHQGLKKIVTGEEHYPSALCPQWHCVYVTTTTTLTGPHGQIPLRSDESEILTE